MENIPRFLLFLIPVIFCLVVHVSNETVQMNGTIFGTPTANITITTPITAQSVQLDNTGLTTRANAGDNLHTYSFDRTGSTSPYSVFWTGLSSSEIDFSIATLGLSDVRTTTTSPQLGIVQIDGINTPYTWTGTVNTILVNAGQKIQEFFIPSTGGGGSVGSGGGPLPVNPTPTTQVNVTCSNGVYDPTTSTCTFGNVNVTIQPTTITTMQDVPVAGNIPVQCSGANSLTIQTVDLGFNPAGIQLGQLPTTIQCGTNIPTTCPTGTTLTGGECVAALMCPISNLVSNGQCAGVLTCPDGTQQNGSQCIVPPKCADGTIPVNNQCQNIGISISVPPTPSAQCDIFNPLSCIMPLSSTETATISGITDGGQAISAQTSITKLTSPQMDNTTFLIILSIIIGMIAAPVTFMIYMKTKRKPKSKKQTKSGKSKTIEEFNKDVRKNKPDKKQNKK